MMLLTSMTEYRGNFRREREKRESVHLHFLFPSLIAHTLRGNSFGTFFLLGFNAGCCHATFTSLLCLYADAKPTAETLGPTVKSEETTTLYPIDEEATECGESCSFEDGEDRGVRVIFYPGWRT